MLAYILRRAALAIITLLAISVLSFAIIQLPPGDFGTTYIASMSARRRQRLRRRHPGRTREQYGLDKPMTVQYLRWMGQIAHPGQLRHGHGVEPAGEGCHRRSPDADDRGVAGGHRLHLGLALPIGIYSAVKRYSLGDYIFTFIGFIGLAVPGFMLALIVLYVGFRYFDANVGGLFSPELADAPWNWIKVKDMINHLPIPAVVLGLSGTAQMIRIMRSNLLDELRKPYVMTARRAACPRCASS